MGSLKSSGWSIEDCHSELLDIKNKFSNFTSNPIDDDESENLENAFDSASLIYLSDFDDPELKKEAFLVCEMLEFIQNKNFWYTKHLLKMELITETYDEDEDGNLEPIDGMENIMNQILEHYDLLFKKHGFKHLRNLSMTFNSKGGNYTAFHNLRIRCFDSPEMLKALVLANEIFNNPYDFMDAAKLATSDSSDEFETVSEYLTYLADLNFKLYFESQLNNPNFYRKIEIGFLNIK